MPPKRKNIAPISINFELLGAPKIFHIIKKTIPTETSKNKIIKNISHPP